MGLAGAGRGADGDLPNDARLRVDGSKAGTVAVWGGAVPGLCGASRDSCMASKLLGQPPMTLGTVPSLLQSCLNERHSDTSTKRQVTHDK